MPGLSAEFLITLAAIAAAWLSLRSDIRALTAELRRQNGEPDRDLEFDKALAAVTRAISEPVSPRDLLKETNASPS
jgi:hypothetical protein